MFFIFVRKCMLKQTSNRFHCIKLHHTFQESFKILNFRKNYTFIYAAIINVIKFAISKSHFSHTPCILPLGCPTPKWGVSPWFGRPLMGFKLVVHTLWTTCYLYLKTLRALIITFLFYL